MNVENVTLGELSRRVERDNSRRTLEESAAYRQRIEELVDEVMEVIDRSRSTPYDRIQVPRYFWGEK